MRNKNIRKQLYFPAVALIFLFAVSVLAQTTAFTYQGKLTDTGNPANGTYQMEFKPFKSNGTTQVGTTITNNAVSVAQGIFTVQLDFGATVEV